MPNLAFALLFMAASLAAVGPNLEVVNLGDVTTLRGDLCAEARRIAESGPCLRPEDCGAFQEWRRIFGEPGFVPLDPEVVVGEGHATRRPRTIVLIPSNGGLSPFNCPAPGSIARPSR